MINYLMKRAALVPAVVAILASGASAATIGFNGLVTTIPGSIPAGAVFPPVGTAATVTLEIDDSDPSALLFDLGSFSFFENIRASVDVPGFLSGSMLNNGDFSSFQADHFAFGAYGPSVLDQTGGNGFFATGRHSFRLNYGAGVVQPTTVGQLVAALSASGTNGFFNHELDRQGGGFLFTRVDFSDSTSVVPLPGGMPLLLGALLLAAGLVTIQRRKALA